MRAFGPVNLAYVRLAVSQLEAAANFASDILGLQAVAAVNGDRAFRSDHRKRTLTLSPGGASGFGVEVAATSDLDAILARLHEHGFRGHVAAEVECQDRSVRNALITQDA